MAKAKKVTEAVAYFSPEYVTSERMATATTADELRDLISNPPVGQYRTESGELVQLADDKFVLYEGDLADYTPVKK